MVRCWSSKVPRSPQRSDIVRAEYRVASNPRPILLMFKSTLTIRLAWLPVVAVAALAVLAPRSSSAQSEDLGPLYMQQPFDRVVLKTGESVEVQKLRFADGSRKVPEVMPAAGALSVRPLAAENAAAQYSIPWSGIARIDLFEDMILQEANRLANEKKFDEAYPFYSYLLTRAPETRQLDDGVNRYLQTNALTAYQAGEFDRSLAILGSLFERSPPRWRPGRCRGHRCRKNHRAVPRVAKLQVGTPHAGCGREHLRGGYPLRWSTVGGSGFQQAAQGQLAEAQRLVDAKNYMAAREAIAQAVGVWPELAGVVQLQSRLQREHPVVSVGVVERAPRTPQHRLDLNASSRVATLLQPLLMELRSYTAEGGGYETPVGHVALDPTGLELNIQLADSPPGEPLAASLAASDLARQIIEAADRTSPHYNEQLAAIVDRVTVEYPRLVRIEFRRPHVRPESLLSLNMSPTVLRLSNRSPFEVAERTGSLVRMVATERRGGSVAEVQERTFDDDEAAVTALLQGTVDVLARVPPWQVSQLQADGKVVVDSYLLPTVHGLVPTGRSAITEQREFRRALCYGIDRDQIIRQVLLAGGDRPGYQPVSGPFPAGVELSDPIRYAYNAQIKPRPYDPYMAIVLSSAAWSNVQKADGVEQPGDAPLPTLKLGHTADAIARTACIEIAKNLNAIGVPVELIELSTEDMLRAENSVDLKYTELSVWEPVADARPLLGDDGELGWR